MSEHNNDQFPVIYNDGKIKIYRNHCNEIFITNIQSEVTIRLDSDFIGTGGLVFTTNALVEPTFFNGMIAWSIRAR